MGDPIALGVMVHLHIHEVTGRTHRSRQPADRGPLIARPASEIQDHVRSEPQRLQSKPEQSAFQHIALPLRLRLAEQRNHPLIGGQAQRAVLLGQLPSLRGLSGPWQADCQEQRGHTRIVRGNRAEDNCFLCEIARARCPGHSGQPTPAGRSGLPPGVATACSLSAARRRRLARREQKGHGAAAALTGETDLADQAAPRASGSLVGVVVPGLRPCFGTRGSTLRAPVGRGSTGLPAPGARTTHTRGCTSRGRDVAPAGKCAFTRPRTPARNHPPQTGPPSRCHGNPWTDPWQITYRVTPRPEMDGRRRVPCGSHLSSAPLFRCPGVVRES